jgi:hypothetical protein
VKLQQSLRIKDAGQKLFCPIGSKRIRGTD